MTGIINKRFLKIRFSIILSLVLCLFTVSPAFSGEEILSPEDVSYEAVIMGTPEVSLTTAVNHSYAEVIHLGECRFLTVSGDKNGAAYSWKVSDNNVLSVNQDGRCKGLSSDSICGYSETLVTAEKNGVKHEMWIKVLPAACVDSSTIGVPGAKWDISPLFKEVSFGAVRYRSTKKKVITVDKRGVAKGKKAGTAEVIKEVRKGDSWVEVDRETFTVYQPRIKTEMVLSRLKYPSLSANKIIISSNVAPAGFMSSKSKVISIDGDMLKLNKQGKATIYTLFGTVGKPLKRYKTRIEVIGKL